VKLQTLITLASLWLICLGCVDRSTEALTTDQINEILAEVNEDDLAFVEKGVTFDSVVTTAGFRELNGDQERVKMRLYYFGDLTRGYFNLADRDEKNLQVFGRKVNDRWALKCVTKLNMEEVGGYIILSPESQDIWANGHYNFKMEKFNLLKQNIDYDDLKTW